MVNESSTFRIALITGAASGIGLAAVHEFATAGYRVAACDITDEGPHGVAARESDGGPYRFDVADWIEVDRAVESIERELGPVEVAVCCAGVLSPLPLDEISDDEWSRTRSVHLGGCYHVARSLASRMRKRGRGSIVNISSELALAAIPDHVHYIAAKSGILGLTRSLARELSPYGIRVNAIAPGPTDTPLLGESGREYSYVSGLPLRRIGRPEEIAAAIRCIAEATWTTGQVYSPNGGAVIQ